MADSYMDDIARIAINSYRQGYEAGVAAGLSSDDRVRILGCSETMKGGGYAHGEIEVEEPEPVPAPAPEPAEDIPFIQEVSDVFRDRYPKKYQPGTLMNALGMDQGNPASWKAVRLCLEKLVEDDRIRHLGRSWYQWSAPLEQTIPQVLEVAGKNNELLRIGTIAKRLGLKSGRVATALNKLVNAKVVQQVSAGTDDGQARAGYRLYGKHNHLDLEQLV